MTKSKIKANTTHFGFEQIPRSEKTSRVGDVFHSVANKYDLMNDLMSLGIHRIWKRFAINLCTVRSGHKVLDLAGGTGDLTAKISPLVGKQGLVIMADINASMLQIGKNRLLDQGLIRNVEIVQANAEKLPFKENYFDRMMIGFGLRNVTDQSQALHSMFHSLKPGGTMMILEFSKPLLSGLSTLYNKYSFEVLPWLGKTIADDEESYRYLAESIRMHPDQETLKKMMEQAGFENCDVHNLSGGIVAIHRGYKF